MKDFKQADRRVISALNRMKSPDMQPLLEFITVLLDDTKDALIRASGDTLYRLQGRAGVLQEFVEGVTTAPAMMEKLPP